MAAGTPSKLDSTDLLNPSYLIGSLMSKPLTP